MAEPRWKVLVGKEWETATDDRMLQLIRDKKINASTYVVRDGATTTDRLGDIHGFAQPLRAAAAKGARLSNILLVVFGVLLVGGVVGQRMLFPSSGGSSSGEGTATPYAGCGDVGEAFHVCVDKVDRGAITEPARIDLSFRNDSHTPDDVSDFADLDFDLESAGNLYGNDRAAELESSNQLCSMITGRLQPGASLTCSVYFPHEAARSATVLDVTHAGIRYRFAL